MDGPSGHPEAPLDALGQCALDGLATGAHGLRVSLAYEGIDIPHLARQPGGPPAARRPPPGEAGTPVALLQWYAHGPRPPAGASRPMVMLVIADDEPRLRLLLRTLLRDQGHDVREAADGEAALREIRARPPAVAILDVQMPGLSGLEVCRQVRADPHLAAVRLLVVSANATEADARAAGADAFLAKPFSPARVLATVADLAPEPPAPPPPPAPRAIRELRAERLLAIRDLARATGLAATTIYEIEAGRRRAGPRARRRIAAALAVDPDDVAEFDTAGALPGEPNPREAAARLEAMGYPRILARRAFGLPPE